jgi:hypothetical protein
MCQCPDFQVAHVNVAVRVKIAVSQRRAAGSTVVREQNRKVGEATRETPSPNSKGATNKKARQTNAPTNPFFSRHPWTATPSRSPCSPRFAKLPQAPVTANPVPHLTSLYHFEQTGGYGDRLSRQLRRAADP